MRSLPRRTLPAAGGARSKVDVVPALQVQYLARFIRRRHLQAQCFQQGARTRDLIGIGFGQTARAVPPRILQPEGLWLRIGPVLNLDFRNSGSRRRSDLPAVKTHHALLDALRSGDGAAAKAALAMDINSAAEVILSGSGLKET